MVRPRSYARRFAGIALLALLPISHAGLRARQSGSTKSILVIPLDKKGKPVPNLTAADFKVTEDNTARQVTAAALATDPLYVALMVDTTQPPPGVIPPTQSLRGGLSDFVKAVLAGSPKAQLSLTEFGGAAVTSVKMTNDAAALNDQIKHLYPSRSGGAVMLEALVAAGNSLAAVPSPRRAIVSVTMGAPETSALQANEVITPVYQSGASVWTVAIQAMGTMSSGAVSSMDSANTPTRDVVLATLTKNSGGQQLTAMSSSALRSLLKRVADALTSQYVVSYTRPDGAPGHNIHASAKGAKTVLMSPLVR